MSKDDRAREAIEETERKPAKAPESDTPPAGPHAKAHLTDKSKTPGTGSLPDNDDDSTTPGSG
ncbi:hypothetical protein [Neorhizobium sp. JUb45]|uniref:hypothetical protein n=1 Tax=unclassified Neorhizobium TaxID=2629175 RepID=UPI0010436C9F|nr:hypothetical protein [Neorhizobium sp. JUb45]TCR02952.1 hypothetical protein EDF70_103378 [Neorhizobium sp. JUb45]